MSEPRKHHYIPVFYLKRWLGPDGQLCEYRQVQPGKVVTRRKFPDGTGYKHNLYRIDGVVGPLAQEVERKFMHMVQPPRMFCCDRVIPGWDGASAPR